MNLTTNEKTEILMAVEAAIEKQKKSLAFLKNIEGRDVTGTIEICQGRLSDLESALKKIEEVKPATPNPEFEKATASMFSEVQS